MRIFRSLAVAAAFFAIPAVSFSADWTPPGPIKMMIGFAAGGGADTQARLIAEAIQQKYGWKILPEQVTGNDGLTLAKDLSKEPADGTAIGMIVTETLTYSAIVAHDPALQISKFTPLATTANFQTGLVAMKGGKFDSWDKVVAASKAGTPIRFGVATDRWADAAYLLGKAAGIKFNIVTVKGGAGIMSGLRGGDLDIGWVAGAQSKPVQQGEMVNILSAIPGKLVDSPNVPTVGDVGCDCYLDGYFMFVAPKGLPKEARDAIAHAINDVLSDPKTQAHAIMEKNFGGPDIVTGEALDKALEHLNDSAKLLLAEASK